MGLQIKRGDRVKEILKAAAYMLVAAVLLSIGYGFGYTDARLDLTANGDPTRTLTAQTVTVRPTAAPSPTPKVYTPLARGDTGPDVSALQKRLDLMGYDVGEIDGIYGQKTEAQVKAFQAKCGLPQTGAADQQTLSTLYEANIWGAYRATPKPTTKPTPKPTQRPTATPKPVRMVWITDTGECYHCIPNCGNSRYVEEVSLSDAKSWGYRMCGNCY